MVGTASEENRIEKVLECGLRRLALAQPWMEKRSASNPSSTLGGLSWQPLNSTFQLTRGQTLAKVLRLQIVRKRDKPGLQEEY